MKDVTPNEPRPRSELLEIGQSKRAPFDAVDED
jgi:hypothetical protein